jgi:glycosyltransferase involved in cell wall biosynthesis
VPTTNDHHWSDSSASDFARTTRSPRCLLVTKEFSTKPMSGGTLRTLALLDTLATRYETTVISPDGVLIKGPGRPLTEAPGSSDGGSPLHQLRTATRYRSISGVRTAGSKLLGNLRQAQGRYDVGIIDHTVLAGLADDVAVGCDRLVISMHNIESDLMAQRAAAATSAKARIAMRTEIELLRRLEKHVADRYPVMVCTEADARALHPRHGAIVCRNGVFAGPVAPTGDRPPYSMVFSGALDWEPNVAGLVWFAEKVWPLVLPRIPQATVTIAGRNPGAEVIAACAAPGITLLPNPPVMATVLDAHGLGIVPLLSGGGSRIKILEYLAAGINIVSTDVGASGLEDIPDELLVRTPIDAQVFADRLVAQLQSPQDTAVLAQDWVRKNYSWDVTLQPLLDFLAD